METVDLLFYILRAELNGKTIDPDFCRDYASEDLYRLARMHDLGYCVADALEKANLFTEPPEFRDAYEKEQVAAVMRTAGIESVLETIRGAFSEARIPFVPLKGALLRALYPDAAMRTSCDIDILVREEDLERAVSVLTDSGFSTSGKRNYHDISLYFGNIHLELHFNICEGTDDIDPLLKTVWNHVIPVNAYEHHEDPAFFAFHHLAHMKYHFIHGGCGIKPFMDLHLMREKRFYPEEELRSLLDKADLCPFYDAVLQLIDVWFLGKPHTDATKLCETYIVNGGAYGSLESLSAMRTVAKKSRLKNALSAVFPRYSLMCMLYPELNGRKAMLPVYYVKRLFDKFFSSDRKKAESRLKGILFQNQKQIDFVRDVLNNMGLGEDIKK